MKDIDTVPLCGIFCNLISRFHFSVEGQKNARRLKDSEEDWGYVNVREGAYTFWWLYYYSGNGSYLDQPLVMWLQV